MPEPSQRRLRQLHMAMAPMIGIRPVDDEEYNDLLTRWEHPLGPCNRPFGEQGWTLDFEGDPIALAVSASTVSKTIKMDDGREFGRGEMVELARIARHPDHEHIMRVMLRLWRVYLAPLWAEYWSPIACVSYAMPGTEGHSYRNDGWQFGGIRRPSGGSGTWTRARPPVNEHGDGKKRLYLWPYPAAGDRRYPPAIEVCDAA